MYEAHVEYTEEDRKENIEFRNQTIKGRIMSDMRGVLFCDKVFNRHGIRILPSKRAKLDMDEYMKR
jgi:hypothetical protein